MKNEMKRPKKRPFLVEQDNLFDLKHSNIISLSCLGERSVLHILFFQNHARGDFENIISNISKTLKQM